MKRLVKAAVVTLSLAAALAAPTDASAHWRHGSWGHYAGWHAGPTAAFGALTGFALGSAVAASARPYYAVPGPTYIAGPYPPCPGPVVGRTCITERWSEWVPGWGREVHRRTVCH